MSIVQKESFSWGKVFIYCVLAVMVVFYLMPLVVMIFTSVKSMDDIRAGNLITFPKEWLSDAWQKAWSGACTGVKCEGVKGYFWNSFLITIPAVAISTFLGSLNGYVLTQWKFRGSNLFFGLLLLGCFIPFQVIILPMSQVMGLFGMANTLAGLIFVHVVYGMAFTTLFFRNYYVSVPNELMQAARMDGAGFFRIYWRIILPISAPIFVVSVIWQFTQVWNDFLFGVVFGGPETQPVTVALNNLVNTAVGVKEYNVDMAAAMIAALPTLFVYMVAGKYFVRGLTAGSVKG